MRLLILATTKFAPTYNEKLISQINYFNSFDNMKADIFIDASLVEIEKMLSTSQYDLIIQQLFLIIVMTDQVLFHLIHIYTNY